MMRSVTWRYLVAQGMRLMTVVAMAGFVAWFPVTRTTTTPEPTPIDNLSVSWGGGS